MKVFASFFKKKRCLSLARGRPAIPARKLSLARGRPVNPARKRFFFEKKNQKTFDHHRRLAAR
jgi:hypothetical protein